MTTPKDRVIEAARAYLNSVNSLGRYDIHRRYKLSDALAALDAAPDDDGGWRPIATAPKDGTHIIVPGGTACWSPAAQAWYSDQSQRFIEWPVRVWRPLPTPPSPESRE